ncbi:MAG: hypothetical protein ABSD40_19270, partial [Streptosporangiaceae bacterium]
GKTAYVVNQNSGTVTPIRTSTGTAGKAVKVGRDPVDMAITPDGTTAYVVSPVPGRVTPIRTATNTLGKAIKVGAYVSLIVITP